MPPRVRIPTTQTAHLVSGRAHGGALTRACVGESPTNDPRPSPSLAVRSAALPAPAAGCGRVVGLAVASGGADPVQGSGRRDAAAHAGGPSYPPGGPSRPC